MNENLANDEYHRGLCKYCVHSKEGDTGKDTDPGEVRDALFPILGKQSQEDPDPAHWAVK